MRRKKAGIGFDVSECSVAPWTNEAAKTLGFVVVVDEQFLSFSTNQAFPVLIDPMGLYLFWRDITELA